MLERSHPGTTVNIAIHEGFGQRTDELEQRLTAWPKPAIAFLHGTWWGSLNPAPTGDVFIRTDGKPIELRSDRKIEDNWDAVLYLEKRRNLTRVDPPGADVLDAEWLAELRRRKAIVGGPDPSPELTGTKYSRQFFPDHPAPGDRIIRRRLDTNVQSQ